MIADHLVASLREFQAAAPRVIGAYSQGLPGPAWVFTGGIHGNEPAGVAALEQVMEVMSRWEGKFAGAILALRGNLAGLRQGVRFIDHDLNRLWSPEQREALRHRSPRLREELESLELEALFTRFFEAHPGPHYLVDLHTTSASSAPFAIISERQAAETLVNCLPIPVVYGLTHSLSTSLNVYIDRNGWMGMALEAGQHQAPESVTRHEAAIWLLLARAGCIGYDQIPAAAAQVSVLEQAAAGVPPRVRVIYRHAISPADQFRMRPGYVNFDPVQAGELLGESVTGPVYAPDDGYIFMPLYQTLGEEGFFIVQQT
ncbi:MAG: succinylglutamate desuccinylase/aspartoacylase family protein [Bacteroidia bacterium]|nr:succinylglutamate desuccinylase/aspartoacylase family protein [Bacteroidia bacterium]